MNFTDFCPERKLCSPVLSHTPNSHLTPRTNKSVAYVKNRTMRNQFRIVTRGNRCKLRVHPETSIADSWIQQSDRLSGLSVNRPTGDINSTRAPLSQWAAWCESNGNWKLQSPWSGNITFPIVGQVDLWVQLKVFIVLSGVNTCFPYCSHSLVISLSRSTSSSSSFRSHLGF